MNEEYIRHIDTIPQDIIAASNMVGNEEAWIHIDDFVFWLESAAKKVVPEGEKIRHMESISYDDGRMLVALPGLHGKPAKKVYGKPMLTDDANVLYGFILSYHDDDVSREEEFVMPMDIIEMLPHGIRGDDGRYPFSLRDFIDETDRRMTNHR
jgi:hypothetical protein